MENDNEQQDDLNLDEIDSETATPEQVTAVVKKAQSALAQRAKFKEQAIDPETGKTYKELLAESKATVVTPPSPTIDATSKETPVDVTETVKQLKLSEDKREFADAQKLNREETDYAFQLAGNDPKKAVELIKGDFFQSALTGLRQKRKLESATPSSSGRSTMVDGKPINTSDPKAVKANWNKLTGQE